MYEARQRKEKVGRRIDAIKNCRKTVQLIYEKVPLNDKDWITKVEKAVGIKNVPILIIDQNSDISSFNTNNPRFLLAFFILENSFNASNLTDEIEERYDGAVYCPKTKAVILTKDRAFNRYLIHELGHAKQDKIHNANSLKGNTNSSYLEVHNIIVNENKYQYVKPATNTEDLYLQVENEYSEDPATVDKINMGFGNRFVYYRIFYTLPTNPHNFIKQNLNIFNNIKITLLLKKNTHKSMYYEMLNTLNRILPDLDGIYKDKVSRPCKINVKNALTALMNWGIKQQIDEYN